MKDGQVHKGVKKNEPNQFIFFAIQAYHASKDKLSIGLKIKEGERERAKNRKPPDQQMSQISSPK